MPWRRAGLAASGRDRHVCEHRYPYFGEHDLRPIFLTGEVYLAPRSQIPSTRAKCLRVAVRTLNIGVVYEFVESGTEMGEV